MSLIAGADFSNYEHIYELFKQLGIYWISVNILYYILTLIIGNITIILSKIGTEMCLEYFIKNNYIEVENNKNLYTNFANFTDNMEQLIRGSFGWLIPSLFGIFMLHLRFNNLIISGLLCLYTIIFLGIVMYVAIKKWNKFNIDINNENGEYRNFLYDITNHNILSRIFNATPFLNQRNAELTNNVFKVYKTKIKNVNFVQNMFFVLNPTIIIGILIYTITSSEFTADFKRSVIFQSIAVINMMNDMIFGLPWQIGAFNAVRANIQLFTKSNKHKSKLILDNNNVENIKIENLNFKYEDRIIFNNFNYEFSKGFYLLNNPSGSGKSTLIKILLGLMDQDGKIAINGQIINNQDPIEYFAYSTQSNTIFDTTVENNITLGLKDTDKLNNICNKLRITHILDKVTGTNGSSISGGELKRVILARMLYFYKPGQVVIFDEPFDGLNNDLVSEVINIIKEFNDNIVIIIDHTSNTSQHIENLKVCNW
jgi:ABC-type transport system involved in cytochrome bd biosynthesis fused ATPase/permease subunit